MLSFRLVSQLNGRPFVSGWPLLPLTRPKCITTRASCRPTSLAYLLSLMHTAYPKRATPELRRHCRHPNGDVSYPASTRFASTKSCMIRQQISCPPLTVMVTNLVSVPELAYLKMAWAWHFDVFSRLGSAAVSYIRVCSPSQSRVGTQ